MPRLLLLPRPCQARPGWLRERPRFQPWRSYQALTASAVGYPAQSVAPARGVSTPTRVAQLPGSDLQTIWPGQVLQHTGENIQHWRLPSSTKSKYVVHSLRERETGQSQLPSPFRPVMTSPMSTPSPSPSARSHWDGAIGLLPVYCRKTVFGRQHATTQPKKETWQYAALCCLTWSPDILLLATVPPTLIPLTTSERRIVRLTARGPG